MQRILNKLAIVSESAKDLNETRVIQAASFKKDPGYEGGPGSDDGQDDALAEFSRKLGESFRKQLSDDKQQAFEAESLAAAASVKQLNLFGEQHLKLGAVDCCEPILGIKAGVTPVYYQFDNAFESSNEKIAALKSSIWGAPSDPERTMKIIEPVSGVIDSNAVEKAIASGRYQLQLCFELALRRNQSTKGNMEWSWRVDTRGAISNIYLMSSSIKDEELTHCVRKRIAGWKFPKARGGSVEIRYPFEFMRDRG
jgi:hypothetical protein